MGKARGVEVRGGGRPVRWRLQVGGGRLVRWRLEVGKAREVEVRGGEGPWGGG